MALVLFQHRLPIVKSSQGSMGSRETKSQSVQLDHRPCDHKGPQMDRHGRQIPQVGTVCSRWKMPARVEHQNAGPRPSQTGVLETKMLEAEELEVASVARAWPPKVMKC